MKATLRCPHARIAKRFVFVATVKLQGTKEEVNFDLCEHCARTPAVAIREGLLAAKMLDPTWATKVKPGTPLHHVAPRRRPA